MGLTKDQQKALDCCLDGKNIFITGGGGVGKTYLIHKIVDCLKESGRSVMLTAPTGRAAQLIGGATCHRAFRIPLKMAWDKDPKPRDLDHLFVTDTVIIDEISMVRMDVFGYIIRCIQRADYVREKNGKPPIQLIVVGDFFQLPPVIVTPKDGSIGDADLTSRHYGFDVGNGYAFQAPEWAACGFTVCELREVVRQKDGAMISMLNRLRYGDAAVLSDIQHATRKKPYSAKEKNVVHLCGKKKTADAINRASLNRLGGPEVTYKAAIQGTVSENDKPAPEQIHLRVGAQVMMLVNTDDYVNGSTGTVVHLGEDCVHVQLNNDEQTVVTVEYASWDVTTYEKGSDGRVRLKVIGWYSQLPLQPAYAITIHKSQGQTLEKAVLCVGKTGAEIFAEGQLYVGASRIKNLANLYIKGELQGIKRLTSRAVLDYYSSIGITFDPAQDISPKVSDPEDEIPKKSRRAHPRKGDAPAVIEKDMDPGPKKQAKKAGEKRVRIAVTALKRPAIIAFAQVLDPGAYMDGSSVFVTEGWADAVKDFLAKI